MAALSADMGSISRLPKPNLFHSLTQPEPIHAENVANGLVGELSSVGIAAARLN
jgi:hypothetical protein